MTVLEDSSGPQSFHSGWAAVGEVEARCLWYLRTGKRGDEMDSRSSRSASCATSPLPQEPIGPNLAFALEEIKKRRLGREWHHLQESLEKVKHGRGLGSKVVPFYLHLHIPSKLQLETIELLQHSLGLRRQVDLEGWRGWGGGS